MARKRDVKPGFFLNEVLAECSPLARLLGIALLMQADREGRIEDRPKKLKAVCLPYDDCDMDSLLTELSNAEYLTRYEAEGFQVIQICKFTEHQSVHPKEPIGFLPAVSKPGETLQGPESQFLSKEGKEGKEVKAGKEGTEESATANSALPPLALDDDARSELQRKFSDEIISHYEAMARTQAASTGTDVKSFGARVEMFILKDQAEKRGMFKPPPESRFQKPEVDRSRAADRKIFKANRNSTPTPITAVVKQITGKL